MELRHSPQINGRGRNVICCKQLQWDLREGPLVPMDFVAKRLIPRHEEENLLIVKELFHASGSRGFGDYWTARGAWASYIIR